MRSFLDDLLGASGLDAMVAHRRTVPGAAAAFAEPERPLPQTLAAALGARGIERLWSHQAEAIDRVRSGADVLAVTPTASGKTLVFALPVLEAALTDPDARALFVYPTKALAQDQVAALRALALAASPLRPPSIEIYDGDTPAHRRRRIRAEPPNVLITNPDMLHHGILAHHAEWAPFLGRLRHVVLDELHVYRGVFGAHVHHILARLVRLAARAGSRPRFLAASATIGNPEEFAELLAGRPFEVVRASGAPTAARHVAFLNPVGVSPYTVAVRVVAAAAGAGLRTIAFTKARRVTELLHQWLVRQEPSLAPRVAPYRAGYLPQERREIESRLFRGDLLAVLTTSALELGIDVGGLDLCVLCGYPGSLMSSWQRIGRTGRKGREAAVVLVAMPDALDQYIVRHPELFFGDAFERAVLDPWNPMVAASHLVCAAAEEPLTAADLGDGRGPAARIADGLVDDGRLRRDASGTRWYAFRRRPHRDVHPRSAGEPFTIVERGSGRVLGTIDGMRVYHECHPEAIYLHAGSSYRVLALDEDRREVSVRAVRADHYTVVLGEKETEILERLRENRIGEHPVGLGRLRVTVRIRGYQKKRLFGGETISEHPLTAPPLTFETVGFWIELPSEWPAAFAARELHFMGGIHAAEHAMIGLYPLLAIADRGDVGGISYTLHPQLGAPAVFLYDGVPGGAGLAERGHADLRRLIERTLEHVAACGCEDGCPACIQSPRCGNGNKPLDKAACLLALGGMLGRETVVAGEATAEPAASPAPASSATAPRRRHGITRRVAAAPEAPAPVALPAARDGERVLVFDLETQRSAEEVGGWSNCSRMGLAVAVVYDLAQGAFRAYRESDVDRLLLDLAMADLVVGFNIDRFDLRVLSGYTEWDLGRIRTCDLLGEIHRRLGFRVSLQHLAEVNLGASKSADGLQSLAWWREGRDDLVEQYCRKDVEVTARLYALGREQGFLLFRDRDDRTLRIPVAW